MSLRLSCRASRGVWVVPSTALKLRPANVAGMAPGAALHVILSTHCCPAGMRSSSNAYARNTGFMAISVQCRPSASLTSFFKSEHRWCSSFSSFPFPVDPALTSSCNLHTHKLGVIPRMLETHAVWRDTGTLAMVAGSHFWMSPSVSWNTKGFGMTKMHCFISLTHTQADT